MPDAVDGRSAARCRNTIVHICYVALSHHSKANSRKHASWLPRLAGARIFELSEAAERRRPGGEYAKYSPGRPDLRRAS
eukprot:353109-Prymnesium_polylepis.1